LTGEPFLRAKSPLCRHFSLNVASMAKLAGKRFKDNHSTGATRTHPAARMRKLDTVFYRHFKNRLFV
jgi:hypothetical protein